MICRILESVLENSPKSVILLGPRQVGKTSLCLSLKPSLTIQLADQEVYTKHLKDPGLIKRIIAAHPQAKQIFVDEIQRLPEMLNTIQSLIDSDKSLKFILTGSSARKLKHGKANLLPGRVFYENLNPLLYWELGEKFDLEKALRWGQLPEIYLEPYGPDLLGAYVSGYLREEIQAEAATRDLASYARFLDLAANVSGQYINYSKLASDSEINKETIRRYFAILEETLLIERIPSYSKVEKGRRARQRDKFIFFDLGVRNSLCGFKSTSLSKEEYGSLFEQWLILQCHYYNKAYHKDWKIMTYRDESGVEVDLIIETSERFLVIEIKSGKQVSEKSFKHLKKTDRLFGFPTEKIVVYQGDDSQKFASGLALPYQKFLDSVIPGIDG